MEQAFAAARGRQKGSGHTWEEGLEAGKCVTSTARAAAATEQRRCRQRRMRNGRRCSPAPFASIEKETMIFGTPRGAGGMPAGGCTHHSSPASPHHAVPAVLPPTCGMVDCIVSGSSVAAPSVRTPVLQNTMHAKILSPLQARPPVSSNVPRGELSSTRARSPSYTVILTCEATEKKGNEGLKSCEGVEATKERNAAAAP